jgi:hypothetical protein
MKELALSLVLLLSAAAAAAATFELTVATNPTSSPNRLSTAPPSAAPAGADVQPQKSGACEAVKAEGCAL